MTTTPAGGAATLSADVAAEIRAWMGRLGVSQAELARRLGQNAQWLSVRISPRANVALNLDEIQRIADTLGILVKDLLPRYAMQRGSVTEVTTRYPVNAERMTPDMAVQRARPVSAPPKRRPKAATSPAGGTPKGATRRPVMVPRLVRA
jgi:transcriptional regulator with XRE-family HTH domain